MNYRHSIRGSAFAIVKKSVFCRHSANDDESVCGVHILYVYNGKEPEIRISSHLIMRKKHRTDLDLL